MIRILEVASEVELAQARELFEEYAQSLGFSLCFQGFDQELAGLPGYYAPPRGRLLLARFEGRLAGCVALRPFREDACELKRLFVRPEFRGHKIGKALMDAVLREARGIGYGRMVLDTVTGKMDRAIVMYREYGFREIPSYGAHPVEGTIFMELALTSTPTP